MCNLQGGGYAVVYRLSARKWRMAIFDPAGSQLCEAIDPTLTAALKRVDGFTAFPPTWLCAHGNWVRQCVQCGFQADLAYDAAREDQRR